MKAGSESVRVGLAQINPTVGDLEGNVRAIQRSITGARKLGIQILAFPEFVLCGYPPEDLLLKPRFLSDCEKALRSLAKSARGIAVIVGAPEPPAGRGKRPYNTAYLLYRGHIAARYRKIHLPNYGVFDEKRYFEAGKDPVVVRFGGYAVGLQICEDIWADDGPMASQVCGAGARLVINISASPYNRRKGPEREKLMQRRARENGAWLCYINLLGGQDELVFDGSSVIVSPMGKTVARAAPFKEDLVVADIKLSSRAPKGRRMRKGNLHPVTTINLPPLRSPAARPPLARRRRKHLEPAEEIYEALLMGTRDYVDKNGFTGVVLGLSGGVDSALSAVIAVDALGAGRVTGVTMPSAFTSRETLQDARLLAEALRIRLTEIPIDPIYRAYIESLEGEFAGRTEDATEENIQARIRGNILMALSNKFGCLVLTIGNKSEVAVGYCTLYGDMAGGFAILKDVPKTLVYRLSRYRNRIGSSPVIPPATIRRKPTAELKPGQLDQDILPPYPMLDRIIELYVERDMSLGEIVRKGLDRKAVQQTIRMIDANEYKRRQAPPGIKITPKAFGRDRRLPITNRYPGAGGR